MKHKHMVSLVSASSALPAIVSVCEDCGRGLSSFAIHSLIKMTGRRNGWWGKHVRRILMITIFYGGYLRNNA
jgi:hypothetical protein